MFTEWKAHADMSIDSACDGRLRSGQFVKAEDNCKFLGWHNPTIPALFSSSDVAALFMRYSNTNSMLTLTLWFPDRSTPPQHPESGR